MSLMTLKDVTKVFGEGRTQTEALHPTNLNLEPGEFVALTGPSGSGKTTMLSIMGALQSPTSGQVILNDQDIAQLKEKQRAKVRFNDFGFILQASNLIPFLTVQEQLKLVDRITKKPNVEKQATLLKELGIWEQRNQYPSQLSGGERQRVAIARAFYHEPKVIFADEPTASLDSKRARQVVQTMAQMAHEDRQAVVMITHDERLLEYVDKVYVMTDGTLQPGTK